MMYDAYLDNLRKAIQDDNIQASAVRALERFPFWQDHELAQVLFARLARRTNLPCPPLKIVNNPCGAVSIYNRSFFPWKGLPYPKEHAELGVACRELACEFEGECAENLAAISRKMRSWQQKILDHKGDPIFSLFLQDRGSDFSTLKKAYRDFLEPADATLALNRFVDEEFGLVIDRSQGRTWMSCGSGCKSGMGAVLLDDVAIINYGLQTSQVGDCSGFGLAGRAQNFTFTDAKEAFSLGFTCSLACESSRITHLENLQDSGNIQAWVTSLQKVCKNHSEMHFTIDGVLDLSPIKLVLFGQGHSCFVAQTHKLNPRSLDRYQGPMQPFAFHGHKNRIKVESSQGLGRMEVIPLAGDDSFWGAEFLVAISLVAKEFHLRFSFEN